MPPVMAMLVARLWISPEVSAVSRVRAIRQSGSSSQSRLCIHARLRMLRSALWVEGSAGSMPGITSGESTPHEGATSGPIRIPSTSPTAGPRGEPQPSRNAPSPAPALTARSPRARRSARVRLGSCATPVIAGI